MAFGASEGSGDLCIGGAGAAGAGAGGGLGLG